jgi:hypothetical protein
MFPFEKVTVVLGKLRSKTPNDFYLLLSRYNPTCCSHLDFDVQDRAVQHGQGKAIPVLAWADPEGLRGKGPQIQGNRHMIGGKVFSPTHQPPLPPTKYSC